MNVSESERFGSNCERAKGSGNKRWAGFSCYQIIAYLVKELSNVLCMCVREREAALQ